MRLIKFRFGLASSSTFPGRSGRGEAGIRTTMENSHDVKDGRRATRGTGWRFVIRREFAPYFPLSEFRDYAAFQGLSETVLKSERRTRVVLLRRRENGEGARGEQSFVLKEYRYTFAPRLRTWLRISKAEQEFNSLLRLRALGVSAVEPAAFGLQRSRLGFVRSCFVATVFLEGAVHLKQWSREVEREKPGVSEITSVVLRRLGEAFRLVHQARFFLFTAKAKNILLRQSGKGAPDLVFIDLPYARSLPWWPLTRWAQGRDLGMFLGSILLPGSEGDGELFYEGYLPDPLGGRSGTLRRRVERAMRASQNRTPLSALVHRAKRTVRKILGIRAAAHNDGW